MLPTVSLGLETGINGHLLSGNSVLSDGSRREPLQPQMRAGLFARYEWNAGEVSISGGLANSAFDFESARGGTDGFRDVYGTVNWLTRF